MILTDYYNKQIDEGKMREGLNPEVMALAFYNLYSVDVLFELILQASFSKNSIKSHKTDQQVDLFVQGTNQVH